MSKIIEIWAKKITDGKKTFYTYQTTMNIKRYGDKTDNAGKKVRMNINVKFTKEVKTSDVIKGHGFLLVDDSIIDIPHIYQPCIVTHDVKTGKAVYTPIEPVETTSAKGNPVLRYPHKEDDDVRWPAVWIKADGFQFKPVSTVSQDDFCLGEGNPFLTKDEPEEAVKTDEAETKEAVFDDTVPF